MPRWWPKRSTSAEDARRRQVVAQAQAVLAKLRTEGQPAPYLQALEPFVDLAPEILALGPAPASLTMRLLFGLCTFEGEARDRFLAVLTEEFAAPSPTLRAVSRSGLVRYDDAGRPVVTATGRRLFARLRAAGAFDA
jgi:hypothetical protein